MKLDWLKNVRTKIGIEGRNIIVVGSIVFSLVGFIACIRRLDAAPIFYGCFATGFFVVGATALFIGLLAKPQPSEVSPKFVHQQIGPQQFILAGGLQSIEELKEFLRHAHHLQYLPPPAGLVQGTATSESDYRMLTPADAAEIAKQDEEGIDSLLEREAIGLVEAFEAAPQQLGTRTARELGKGAGPVGEKEKKP